jgi:hypothetical protein
MSCALFCAAGLIAGFVCCWAIARNSLDPLKDMFDAAGYKFDED